MQLGAVNSINWARILAQITYYFYAYLRITDAQPGEDQSADLLPLNFAVPTGNFGDILAGYYAKRMGLPVDRLVICANKNDVLHRFMSTGEYRKVAAESSPAPSMDISVSSNFERYLFYLAGESSALLRSWMEQFETTGTFSVPPHLLQLAQRDFLSYSCDDEEIFRTIGRVQSEAGYLVCPHTATAMAAVHALQLPAERTVVLATAHPLKFEDAIRTALTQHCPAAQLPEKPYQLMKLRHLPVRKMLLPNSLPVVQSYIRKVIADALRRKAGTVGASAASWWRWGSTDGEGGWWTIVAPALLAAVAVGGVCTFTAWKIARK